MSAVDNLTDSLTEEYCRCPFPLTDSTSATHCGVCRKRIPVVDKHGFILDFHEPAIIGRYGWK